MGTLSPCRFVLSVTLTLYRLYPFSLGPFEELVRRLIVSSTSRAPPNMTTPDNTIKGYKQLATPRYRAKLLVNHGAGCWPLKSSFALLITICESDPLLLGEVLSAREGGEGGGEGQGRVLAALVWR